MAIIINAMAVDIMVNATMAMESVIMAMVNNTMATVTSIIRSQNPKWESIKMPAVRLF